MNNSFYTEENEVIFLQYKYSIFNVMKTTFPAKIKLKIDITALYDHKNIETKGISMFLRRR